MKPTPTSSNDEPRFFSLGGAARYTTLSIGTLRRLLREKKLRGYRPSGRRVLIDRAELDAFVRAGAGGLPPVGPGLETQAC
jgi:excisionase family DNA binding protein